MIRTFSALAMVTSLSFVSTAGATAGTITVKVLAYLPISDQVFGNPVGLEPPRLFARSPQFTEHLVGPPPTQFPPSPCRVYASNWNDIVLSIPEAAAEGDDDESEAYEQLSFILGLMAISQCNVEIVRNTSTSPHQIVSIKPVP